MNRIKKYINKTGVKRIDKILKLYAKLAKHLMNGESIEIGFASTFGCYPREKYKKIEIGLFVSEKNFKEYRLFYFLWYGIDVTKENLPIMFFLHEIGHLKTWDYLTGEESKIIPNEEEMTLRDYHNLQRERLADIWVSKFLNEKNNRKFKRMINRILQAYCRVTVKDFQLYCNLADED